MKYKTNIITINGRNYTRVEDMPPEVREQYERALEAFRATSDVGESSSLKVVGPVVKESFVYNGKTYHSRDELPPEVRAALDQLPAAAAGEGKNDVVVTTTKTLPSRTCVVSDLTEWEARAPKESSFSPWSLVLVLAIVVVVLLVLWLTGVRPGNLLRR